MSSRSLTVSALAALAVVLTGCNATGAIDPPPAFPTGQVKANPFTPNSDAGLGVTPDADPSKLSKLVAMRNASGAFGAARSDPFALTSAERYFETSQLNERIFGTSSPFTVQLTPKPQVEDEVVVPEPQPYRRLSGIVVGDSILAILEEEGRAPVIVTPGMMLPNSPWRVISIDQDKAVLRRAGKVLPTQVIVRLETPRYGTQPTGGAPGAPGNPGNPGGFGPVGGDGG